MSEPITVIKNDHTGEEVWRYDGVVVERAPSYVVLDAHFDREDMDLGYVTFRRNDRFRETFYADRWYSVFEIYDVEDGDLKGWYCNFSHPAVIENRRVSADDLALDLFVYPDGHTLVLDEDEFEELGLSDPVRAAVLAALEELQARVAAKQPPFEQIG